jgi:hypothetical protein
MSEAWAELVALRWCSSGTRGRGASSMSDWPPLLLMTDEQVDAFLRASRGGRSVDGHTGGFALLRARR